MKPPDLILASASLARLKLLQMAGFNPVVCQSDFDESQVTAENLETLVKTLAKCKAESVAQQWQDCLILGCDSLLTVQGEVYGKPETKAVAIQRWLQMRGQVGELYTGHTLIDQRQSQIIQECGVTKVYFADLDDSIIEAYVNTEEPLKCAGNFALEGKGSLFVEKIEGCHTNVIGLSLPLLHQMLAILGYQVTQFWTS